jgi:sulfur carrier protein ThiS
MKIKLEYVAVLKTSGPPSGSTLTLPGGTTITTLLDHIGVSPAHQKVLSLFINETKVRADAVLVDGDRVFIGVPMGGG